MFISTLRVTLCFVCCACQPFDENSIEQTEDGASFTERRAVVGEVFDRQPAVRRDHELGRARESALEGEPRGEELPVVVVGQDDRRRSIRACHTTEEHGRAPCGEPRCGERPSRDDLQQPQLPRLHREQS